VPTWLSPPVKRIPLRSELQNRLPRNIAKKRKPSHRKSTFCVCRRAITKRLCLSGSNEETKKVGRRRVGGKKGGNAAMLWPEKGKDDAVLKKTGKEKGEKAGSRTKGEE